MSLIVGRIRDALWLVPALMTVGCAALAFALLEADALFETERLIRRWPRLFGDSPEGARTMLVGIAGAMITVLGVVFSITVVTLSLASNQYTSRILRNFVRDRGNQVTLGVFVAVFVYCLIVLRTIRGGDDAPFVPTVAVLGGVILAIAAAATMIYFIHHIATSIQASTIVERAADETLRAIDRIFPRPPRGRVEGREAAPAAGSLRVLAKRAGYLQAVELDRLEELGRTHGTIHVHPAVGDFVREGSLLATAGTDRAGDASDAIRRAFHVGGRRTIEQDVEYGLQQLVDIALKALSPGINDTTTAILCIDWLGAILDRLAGRELEPHVDPGCCVLVRPPSFDRFASVTLDPIRQHGGGNVAVLTRLLELLRQLAPADAAVRAVLAHHARLVLETARRTVPCPDDLRRIEEGE